MAPAAAGEDHSHHQAQEQQSVISELRELRKHGRSHPANAKDAIAWEPRLCYTLLQLDQSDHVAAVAVYGVYPHVVERVLELRILRHHGIGQVARIGLRGVEIRSAGHRVFDREVKVLVGLEPGHISDGVALAIGLISHSLPLYGNVTG